MSEHDELDKRDTLRDAKASAGSGNTLRGLNTGAPTADDGPPSSGMGPVIVPGVNDPAPVEAPPLEITPRQTPPLETPALEQVALEKKSSVPRLLQQGVTVPPEWLPKAKVEFSDGDEEQRTDYSPPEEPPIRTEHKTFELQTVKVDPYADPRTAPTQRKLRAPPAAPDSSPPSRMPSQMAIWLPIILTVLAFGVIVILAIVFRGRGSDEAKGPTPVLEPATAALAPPTVAAPMTATVTAEPTARVVAPEPTEPAPASEPAPSAERPKKAPSTRPRNSSDPFGRAF